MNRHFSRILTASALALALNAAFAADTPPAPTAAPSASQDKLAKARALSDKKDWAGAVEELKRVNDTGSADWNNLMGYNLRKGKTPDLASAEKYYNEALRINPKHCGALEYSGELYLMKNDLPTAEGRLARLGTDCARSEEQQKLTKAIADYKANGNKYVAQ